MAAANPSGRRTCRNEPLRRRGRSDTIPRSGVEEIKGFFRKGRIGSWRDQFTADEGERFDALLAERLAGSGLTFEFE